MDNSIVSEQERQEFMYLCKTNPVFFVQNALRDEYGEPYILESYQKEFLNCDARNRVLFWARRLSKSLMIKFELLHKSAFNLAFKSMVVSPSWEQSKEFGEDIQDIVNSTEWLERMFTSMSKTKFKLKNNSRFSMVSAGNKGISNLGKGVRLLAFDETQQIPDDVFTFLRPTLLGQKKGLRKWLIYAGTPLGRIGQFYDIYNKGRFYVKMDGIYENPDVEPQAVGDYIVFERPTVILSEDGTEIIGTGTNRVTIDEMIMEMNDLPTTGFLREYALQFLDAIGEVFSRGLIESVLDRNRDPLIESNKPIIMGLDLGKHRYSSVLTIAEVPGKNKADIGNVIEYPLETDYHDLCNQIIKLRARYPNTFEIRMDETGVGKGVIEIFERAFEKEWRGVDIVGFDFSGPRKKKEFVEAGVAMLEQGGITMNYNTKMINEMYEFRREITDKQNIIYRKPQGGSDDYVDSLLLTLLGIREYYDFDQEGHNDIVQTSNQLLSFARDKLRKVRI
jgi:hypothetical protein